MNEFAMIELGTGKLPIIATAIHHGHGLRPELQEYSALHEDERLREEDPFTGKWTFIADKRIVVDQSRFEVDLNRPREKAVYRVSEDAWGLHLWKRPLPLKMVETSVARYDAFYARIFQEFTALQKHYSRMVVFDLHSYNYRRDGREAPEADPAFNPEVNIGTATMNRAYWAPVVDRFMADLHEAPFLGRHLDVRENVKFTGGYFSRWIHEHFPDTMCCLPIEFKKFFMDEWTGDGDNRQILEIGNVLRLTIPGVLEALRRLESKL